MPILQVGDKLLSMDLITECFSCNLDECHGACCIEGDSGAPVTLDEELELEELVPVVQSNLTHAAQRVIKNQGVAYTDTDGTLVTSLVDGRNCVFTTMDNGCCHCAIEKACRAGKTSFLKPLSCHLYPIRVSRVGDLWALNYHRWNICADAVRKGRAEHMPIYRYLKEPLTRAFGEAWYAELEHTVEELKRNGYLD
jgi:hypothetical protein